MEKKKYIVPKITVFKMEPSQIMAVSGWTPDGEPSHGFEIVEEGDDNYSDDDF